jgi:hypothetical protein
MSEETEHTPRHTIPRSLNSQEICQIKECFSYDPMTGIVSRIKGFGSRAKLGPADN